MLRCCVSAEQYGVKKIQYFNVQNFKLPSLLLFIEFSRGFNGRGWLDAVVLAHQLALDDLAMD